MAKKYQLNNSYFKNKAHGMPDTILEIALYQKEHGELPFEYSGQNWVYDAFCESQKREGVYNSQYLTPDATADRMMHFAGKYFTQSYAVLDACCGTGQLTKELIKDNYNVLAFEIDSDMVQLCQFLYPALNIKHSNFEDMEGVYPQIIANPPYEVPVLTKFLNWVLSVQNSGDLTILLIPKGFILKTSPKHLLSVLQQFYILEAEDMREEFARTKVRAEIVVLKKK